MGCLSLIDKRQVDQWFYELIPLNPLSATIDTNDTDTRRAFAQWPSLRAM